jgi:hypothetical protein
MQDVSNSFSNYRAAIFDPDWFYYTVCGFCRSVCSPRREDRLANRKLIINSGTVALKFDGSHKVADENTVEMPTPFGLRVVVRKEDLTESQAKARKWPGQFPLDRAVIEYLYKRINSAETKGCADD